MKIKDILNQRPTNEEANLSAKVKDFKPGQSITYAIGDKEIMQDLKQNPSALSFDDQGNPIINTASIPNQAQSSANTSLQQKLQPGTTVPVNTTQTTGTNQIMGSPTNKPVSEKSDDDVDSIKKLAGVKSR